MTEKIVITTNISVHNGPSINVNRVMEVQAYEKINVSINTGDVEKAVQLWPSDKNSEVLLLAIVSSWYGKGESDSIKYKVNEAEEGEGIDEDPEFILDQPHILLGNSSVAMLDSKPKQLRFSYTKEGNAPEIVQIQILIGLKVTS